MTPKSRIITNRFSTRAIVSARTFRACAAFGLVPHHDPVSQRALPRAEPSILEAVTSAHVTHITGHSGSGKTTLLRSIAAQLPIADAPMPIDTDRTVFDQIHATYERTAALLCACGLAEPKLWAHKPSELSTGQAARLEIVRTLSAAKPGQVVAIDELASTLDRVTAAAVCAALPKLARRTGVRIITAASAEDIPGMLDACVTIDAASQQILPSVFSPVEITIEQGTIDDYHALKHHHYRVNDPAIVDQVLRAVRTDPRFPHETIGVLCVSPPTLNASWRRAAFGDRFSTGDKSTDACRLNAELRTISRIIAEPRSRSLGVATRLARAYLADPVTPCTEAIASIGTLTGFFKRAGMTAHTPRRSNADLRLLDALEHARSTPHDLTRSKPDALLARELATWARARKLDPNDPNINAHAAVRLLSSPRAYTHTLTGGNHEHTDRTDNKSE